MLLADQERAGHDGCSRLLTVLVRLIESHRFQGLRGADEDEELVFLLIMVERGAGDLEVRDALSRLPGPVEVGVDL